MVRDPVKEISGGVSVMYQLNYPPKGFNTGLGFSFPLFFLSDDSVMFVSMSSY